MKQLESEAKELMTRMKSKAVVAQLEQPAARPGRRNPTPRRATSSTRASRSRGSKRRSRREHQAYQERPKRKFIGARTAEYRFAALHRQLAPEDRAHRQPQLPGGSEGTQDLRLAAAHRGDQGRRRGRDRSRSTAPRATSSSTRRRCASCACRRPSSGSPTTSAPTPTSCTSRAPGRSPRATRSSPNEGHLSQTPRRVKIPDRWPMQTINLTSHFLIAMPAMSDPNFSRTLTFVCEHNERGALGIVVNRPIEVTLDALFRQVEIPLDDSPLAGAAGVLRRPGAVRPRLRAASPGGRMEVDAAGGRHRAHHVARHPRGDGRAASGPREQLVALGYAGWAPGQLEDEILRNGWLTVRRGPGPDLQRAARGALRGGDAGARRERRQPLRGGGARVTAPPSRLRHAPRLRFRRASASASRSAKPPRASPTRSAPSRREANDDALRARSTASWTNGSRWRFVVGQPRHADGSRARGGAARREVRAPPRARYQRAGGASSTRR